MKDPDEGPKGPGSFTCLPGNHSWDCQFSGKLDSFFNSKEPSMNTLISQFFGDPSISLSCVSGECLQQESLPNPTFSPDSFLLNGLFVGSLSLLAIMAFFLFRSIRERMAIRDTESIRSPENSFYRTMQPCNLKFVDLSLSVPQKQFKFLPAWFTQVNDKPVLKSVSGSVSSGEVLAIMGPSGSGKTTLLNVLANRSEYPFTYQQLQINGINGLGGYKHLKIGFVEQDDLLMGRLTVFETVLYSAMLRLSPKMSLDEKSLIAFEVLEELGLLHVKDQYVGDERKFWFITYL
jgi:ABC-type multidrug transport system fused ATPase/permease subunit